MIASANNPARDARGTAFMRSHTKAIASRLVLGGNDKAEDHRIALILKADGAAGFRWRSAGNLGEYQRQKTQRAEILYIEQTPVR